MLLTTYSQAPTRNSNSCRRTRRLASPSIYHFGFRQSVVCCLQLGGLGFCRSDRLMDPVNVQFSVDLEARSDRPPTHHVRTQQLRAGLSPELNLPIAQSKTSKPQDIHEVGFTQLERLMLGPDGCPRAEASGIQVPNAVHGRIRSVSGSLGMWEFVRRPAVQCKL